jgi:hypothetical protein
MFSNEALMKTLRLQALLSRGPDEARGGVDEQRIALGRSMVASQERQRGRTVGARSRLALWTLLRQGADQGYWSAHSAVAATAVAPASCQPVSAH